MDNKRGQYESLLISAGCDPRVIAHCRAVCETAFSLAGDSPFVDQELLLAGAMLHDIGRSKTHALNHAQAGADYCRSIGIDERVCRMIECHTGAGLTADECSLLRLAPRNCIPETLEEKLVTDADNLVKGHHRITIGESIGDIFYLPRKVRRRMYHLHSKVLLTCD